MEAHLSGTPPRGFTLIELIIVIAVIAILVLAFVTLGESGKKTADCVRDVANAKTELQSLIVEAPNLTVAEMSDRLTRARRRLNELQVACCEKAKADLSYVLTQAIQAVDTWLLEHASELTPEQREKLDSNKLTPISGC